MNDREFPRALITGASRGIGRAVAERLAADGFAVAINYAGKSAEAEALARSLEAANARVQLVKADVSDPAAVRRMFDDVERAWGPLDVLVNNAGVMKLSTLAETDDVSFDSQVAVNLKGSFNTMREAAKRLKDGGRIINFSSSVVGLRFPTYAAYAATKAAVETMTAILAKEVGGRRICVNAVAPGPTGTDLFLQDKSIDQIDKLGKMAALGRLGSPNDIAAVVSFLAGPDAAWVTGQVIRANGGIV
jgi:3-oxoacyl-[acyl-carrier protein] reductase